MQTDKSELVIDGRGSQEEKACKSSHSENSYRIWILNFLAGLGEYFGMDLSDAYGGLELRVVEFSATQIQIRNLSYGVFLGWN